MSSIFSSPPGLRADVVGAGVDDDDLRIHVVELAVFDAPQHVLDAIAAPAEVRRIPAEEILLPVR